MITGIQPEDYNGNKATLRTNRKTCEPLKQTGIPDTTTSASVLKSNLKALTKDARNAIKSTMALCILLHSSCFARAHHASA